MAASLNLTGVLEKIHEEMDGDRLLVCEIVEILNNRGFGPILLAASLFTILPTGAIPGVPTVTALLITCIAGQLVLGKKHPWIPNRLGELSIERTTFEEARKSAEPYTKTLDRFIKPRLSFLTGKTSNRTIAAICIALALLMPPLELIPFAAFVPAFAIGLFGIGLSAKDGLAILFGIVMTISTLGLTFFWLT